MTLTEDDIIRRTEKEREWDDEYTQLSLDNECYYNREDMTTFLLLNNKQLEQIKKWTIQNCLKYMDTFGKEYTNSEDLFKLLPSSDRDEQLDNAMINILKHFAKED